MDRLLIVTAKGGTGKALANTTPIPTPDGWTTMGQLRVGDVVFDEYGSPANVTGVYPQPPGRPCFEVTFDDGATIVADADHLWATVTRADRLQRWREWRSLLEVQASDTVTRVTQAAIRIASVSEHVALSTTEEIADSLKVSGETNHAIPLVAQPLAYPHRDLPIAPYVLGAWLGDGHSADGRITCADNEIEWGILRDGYQLSTRRAAGSKAHTFTVYNLRPQLRKLHLLQNKHIPVSYLTADPNQRLALLQGLMDTDGTADSRTGRVSFTTTRKQLGLDVLELFRSLGAKPTIRRRDAKLNGRVTGPAWDVSCTPCFTAFQIHRKAIRQKLNTTAVSTRGLRYIKAVHRALPVPLTCIHVDSPSHLFLASRAMIPTHNTTTVANTGVELARQGKRVLLVDTDPQGHVATHFSSYDLSQATPLENLIRDPRLAPVAAEIPLSPLPDKRIRRRRSAARGTGTLSLLPCSDGLNDVTAAIAAASYAGLGRILDHLEDDYDLCLIDRQGALTVPAHMAIRASDSYLFVGEPAFLAYVELVKTREQLQRLHGRSHIPLVEVGYLPTRTAVRSKRLREYTAHFANPDEFDPPMFVFSDPIRQSEGIFDDPRYGQPSALVDPHGHAAEDYRTFARELVARLDALKATDCFGAETPNHPDA